jgi:GAF domain-containing protein
MKALCAKKGAYNLEPELESHLSFAPFVRALKEMAASTTDIRGTFYKYIIDKFEANPAVMRPFANLDELNKYQEYLDLVIATIFPVTSDPQRDIYGLGVPARLELFYYSDRLKQLFAKGTDQLLVTTPEETTLEKANHDKLTRLYKMIIERMYHFPVSYLNDIIHPIDIPESGLKKYIKLNIDTRFVEIKAKGELPPLNYAEFCSQQLPIEVLKEILPLSLFHLEGFVIWTVEDVTQEEVLNHVKDLVLNMDQDNETGNYQMLDSLFPTLLGKRDTTAHLVPFPKINGASVLEEQFCYTDTILGIMGNKKQQRLLFQQLLDYATRHPYPLIVPDVNEASVQPYPFLKHLPLKGIKSFILCPILHQDELLGVLELASPTANDFSQETLSRLQSAYPLLVLLLNRSINLLNGRINQVIKEQFTALQPSVEWKFTDAAWQYLSTPEQERKEIGNITFDEVYPLYGAIDIRNSSVQQGNAIREDLLEQLNLVKHTLDQVNKAIHLPLLEELQYKNDSLLNTISTNLQAGEDLKVNEFVDYEIAPILKHLYESNDKLKPVLNQYFSRIDKTEGHVYNHRREYEESLAKINTVISQYLEKERHNIQQSFPCYFEKYRTDGIEYTIYIGQSIAYEKKFDLLYLRNLRLWQLTSMAQIAKLTHQLSPQLKVPLKTTQLLLMHSAPITISFRNDERRFDVEGAYNIRYEIIKKRIDKVHIKDSDERLTQPGTIAIVFSYGREMEEYRKYISFLQEKKILKPGLEILDLEELQGVSGLKALRVNVNLDEEISSNKEETVIVR